MNDVAKTWYDYDEWAMQWLSASGLCERGITRAEFNAGMKKVYPPAFIHSLVHRDNPFLAMMNKRSK